MPEKISDRNTKKLQLGHNMTTAMVGFDRPISEEERFSERKRYCGIREFPDFMEIEPIKEFDIGF